MIGKYSFMDSVFDITSKNLLLFSRSVMFNSLWSHRPRHTRLSCPSLSPQGGQRQWSGWGALYSTRFLGRGPSQGGQQQQRGRGTPSPGCPPTLLCSSQQLPQGLCPGPWLAHWPGFIYSRGPPVRQPGCCACPLATWNSWRVCPC